MPIAAHLILLALLIIGAAMWIGGMVAVTMLSVISKRALAPADRTALFHRFGKTYFPVFGTALVIAAAAGFIMLMERGWDGIAWAITILVIVTLIALGFGVAQARSMGRLRSQAAELRSAASSAEEGPEGSAAEGPEGSAAEGPGGGAATSIDGTPELARLDASIASGAKWAALLRGSLGVLSAAVFILAICTAAV